MTEGAMVTGSGILSDCSKFKTLDPTQEPIFPPQLKVTNCLGIHSLIAEDLSVAT